MNEGLHVEKRVDDGESDIYAPDGYTGIWEVYWLNGQLKNRSQFVGGKQEGEHLCLWDNGNVAQRGMMKNDHCIGIWIDYAPEGHKTLECTYDAKGQQGVRKSFWSNGKIMSETEYKDGQEHGAFRLFDFEGKLQHEGEYRNGKPHSGICRIYTFNHEEGYSYLAEFDSGKEIRRLPKE